MKTSAKPPHIGRKISRIRELRGMKQEALAEELGVSQQMVSKIEQSENVEDEMLERMAKALGVTPEAIKGFNEEATINYINNIQDSVNSGTFGFSNTNSNCTFNPIEKVVELYEKLLQSEREKVEILKELRRREEE